MTDFECASVTAPKQIKNSGLVLSDFRKSIFRSLMDTSFLRSFLLTVDTGSMAEAGKSVV